jgi:hypothetical protein
VRRAVLAAALAGTALLVPAATAPAALPPVKHVFIVILENEDADSTFGPGTHAPYLAQTLRARGGFIPGFYAIGHLSLDNYIAMVSGQGPNPYTQADAPAYVDFVPGLPGPDGQALGAGSVYPASVKTIVDQLDAKGRTWRGYMEDMGNTPGEPKTCRHPAVGSPDETENAREHDQYAMRHNPFMYFHSIIDDQARCDARVVPLDRLPADLQSAASTPNYSFITPDLCSDGHDEPCVDGRPGGMVSANAFLKQWIPRILGSPAYRDGGLVIITFDEAENHDASSCCGQTQGPNTPNNGGPTPGTGGGRIGAVLLSQFIKPGTVTKRQYNHYSMLRSLEDLFGLGHLGFAAADGLRPFGDDLFNNKGAEPLPPVPRPTLRIAGMPERCVREAFRVRMKATGSGIRIRARLDGRLVRSKRGKRLSMRVSAVHAGPGRHRVSGTAIDRFGRRAKKSRRFRVCEG